MSKQWAVLSILTDGTGLFDNHGTATYCTVVCIYINLTVCNVQGLIVFDFGIIPNHRRLQRYHIFVFDVDIGQIESYIAMLANVYLIAFLR